MTKPPAMASTPRHARLSAMRSEQSGSIKVSERERIVLAAFVEEHEPGSGIYMRTIVSATGLDASAVRRATRALARKGLTKLVRGLFYDDGLLAGSGYAATDAGISLIRAAASDAHGAETREPERRSQSVPREDA